MSCRHVTTLKSLQLWARLRCYMEAAKSDESLEIFRSHLRVPDESSNISFFHLRSALVYLLEQILYHMRRMDIDQARTIQSFYWLFGLVDNKGFLHEEFATERSKRELKWDEFEVSGKLLENIKSAMRRVMKLRDCSPSDITDITMWFSILAYVHMCIKAGKSIADISRLTNDELNKQRILRVTSALQKVRLLSNDEYVRLV